MRERDGEENEQFGERETEIALEVFSCRESDAMQSETERETAPYMETGTHESSRVGSILI